MTTFATGAAFLDRSGAVLAADEGFLRQLGLAPGDADALRARADSSPELRQLLAGEGPDVARVAGRAGAPVELERVAATGGLLLVVRGRGELLEQAMRSQGLTRLAAGLAHDIKNPLNAMALQLALLADKLGSGDAAAASTSHLAAIREQISRVNEVLRRFLDVADPAAPLGFTDVGALLADAAALFSHDARRRRVELAVDAPRGTVRSLCEPARAARMLLGMFTRALAEVPEGGRLAVRAEVEGDLAVVRLEHGRGDPDAEAGYYSDVIAAAARATGGGYSEERDAGSVRLTLRLPRNERA